MKMNLTVEIGLVIMAIVVMGTWEAWLTWPEAALISSALCVVAALVIVRRIIMTRAGKP